MAILALAGAGWWILDERAAEMAAEPGPMGLGFWAFLAVWAVMMAAMMLPVVAPVASMYAGSIVPRTPGPARSARIAAMVAGYLVVWSAVGVLAYGATLAARAIATDQPDAATWCAAAVFGVTAAYQLSPLRARCLRHCRAPFALLFRMTAQRGPMRDLRAGVLHGGICAACCIPLMACLLALGAMSIGWMLLLTAVVVLERHPRHGRWMTYGAVAGLLVLAVVVPFHPELAPGLHRPDGPMPM
jgi:predicted metal-binding membrane protein